MNDNQLLSIETNLEQLNKMFNLINEEALSNILSIVLTFLVLNLERFNSFKESHPLNILVIWVTFSVLKLFKFNSFSDEHL